jgi:hypothetical protein
VGVLMKILLILLTLFSLGFAEQKVFMLDGYDKEIELEAKIVHKISSDIFKRRANIYIPDISEKSKEIYSKYFDISKSCFDADFVFDKNNLSEQECIGAKTIYFTNNYRRLMSSPKYIGAFFWNKSRPNIVFIKDRLDKKRIYLSSEYKKYIEDIDD